MFVKMLSRGSSFDNYKRKWLWVPGRASLARDDGGISGTKNAGADFRPGALILKLALLTPH